MAYQNASFVNISADVVLFTIQGDALSVLLVRRPGEPFKGSWSLPGGLVQAEEALEDSAVRLLREKTGLTGVYLEQLYTFGRPDRDPRGRVISVAYYALAPTQKLKLVQDADSVRWFSMLELPALAFDHRDVVDMAHQRLSAKLDYSTIAFQFLPGKFTLSELQSVYESILGEPLDKRNFRKRVQTLNCIEETGETYRAGKHRPAKLFRHKRPGSVQIIK